jgi:hypothetical protein
LIQTEISALMLSEQDGSRFVHLVAKWLHEKMSL